MRRQRAPGERCFTSFGPPPRATAGGRLSYCQPQRGSHKTCRHTRTHILLYSHRTHSYYTSQFCALHYNHVYCTVWTCGDAFFLLAEVIRMEAFTLGNAFKQLKIFFRAADWAFLHTECKYYTWRMRSLSFVGLRLIFPNFWTGNKRIIQSQLLSNITSNINNHG